MRVYLNLHGAVVRLAWAAVVATFYVKIVIVVTKLTHIQWEAG